MAQKTVHSTKAVGSSVGDAIARISIDTTLADMPKGGIQNALNDLYSALGGHGVNVGKTVTASYDAGSTYITAWVGIS